jgi:hypothetical protein
MPLASGARAAAAARPAASAPQQPRCRSMHSPRVALFSRARLARRAACACAPRATSLCSHAAGFWRARCCRRLQPSSPPPPCHICRDVGPSAHRPYFARSPRARRAACRHLRALCRELAKPCRWLLGRALQPPRDPVPSRGMRHAAGSSAPCVVCFARVLALRPDGSRLRASRRKLVEPCRWLFACAPLPPRASPSPRRSCHAAACPCARRGVYFFSRARPACRAPDGWRLRASCRKVVKLALLPPRAPLPSRCLCHAAGSSAHCVVYFLASCLARQRLGPARLAPQGCEAMPLAPCACAAAAARPAAFSLHVPRCRL